MICKFAHFEGCTDLLLIKIIFLQNKGLVIMSIAKRLHAYHIQNNLCGAATPLFLLPTKK